jgi:hypothetical protein
VTCSGMIPADDCVLVEIFGSSDPITALDHTGVSGQESPGAIRGAMSGANRRRATWRSHEPGAALAAQLIAQIV